MDSKASDKSEPLPAAGTLVRTTCEHGSVGATIEVERAEDVAHYASLVAQGRSSERLLAEFVRDQVNGRIKDVESAIDAVHPGYMHDVALKISFFTLGLLMGRRELGEKVQAALRRGCGSIDVGLMQSYCSVRIIEQNKEFYAHFSLDDASELPSLH